MQSVRQIGLGLLQNLVAVHLISDLFLTWGACVIALYIAVVIAKRALVYY
jgi:hypothetical protein